MIRPFYWPSIIAFKIVQFDVIRAITSQIHLRNWEKHYISDGGKSCELPLCMLVWVPNANIFYVFQNSVRGRLHCFLGENIKCKFSILNWVLFTYPPNSNPTKVYLYYFVFLHLFFLKYVEKPQSNVGNTNL